MRRGNRATTLPERLEIWERAQNGESDRGIGQALHLSRVTVRKWRRKMQRQGRDGLVSGMGRPTSGPLGQFSVELRDTLEAWRRAHPGWGADTLCVELAGTERFTDLPLPSRARIAAFLKAKHLTRPYQRHTQLTQPEKPGVLTCHEEWEMDAQGVCQVSGVGRVSLVNIGDPCSHVRASWPCIGTSKPETPDYQLALRRAFFRYGLPKGISLDHDSAFYDNTCPSPFPSRLHLWLISLAVAVRFLDRRPPLEHAFIERSHQIVDQQGLKGQAATAHTLPSKLDQRLDFLNQRYPSRSLNGQPPLQAYPQAAHSGREYRVEWEADLLDLPRVYAYLAQQHWFRQVTAAGQFALGASRYGLGKAWGHQTIEITFDPHTQEFVCTSADGKNTQRLPAKGLTKQDLMGELNMQGFPHYQYAFPWSRQVARSNILHAELTGTTL
jgi:hypothetical protein